MSRIGKKKTILFFEKTVHRFATYRNGSMVLRNLQVQQTHHKAAIGGREERILSLIFVFETTDDRVL
jgi:hypothetical protein